MKRDKAHALTCPVCGGIMQAVRTLTPVANEATGYYKFHDKIVHVCKCNHAEIYGS